MNKNEAMINTTLSFSINPRNLDCMYALPDISSSITPVNILSAINPFEKLDDMCVFPLGT